MAAEDADWRTWPQAAFCALKYEKQAKSPAFAACAVMEGDRAAWSHMSQAVPTS